ncbi:hypothetical protein P22_0010 [Propionispora sp. 2/2-37]|uniref:ArnT family glycosyltransferase n=1 Tax=Propionispora sp. 2/2-37 TaxID=1677858 RepID=UPI0006BB8D33|nr:glycosyltransferase family 39 protein [Propionispora sp. 2/2-37]CUH93948.1 hypothetical protein P22_0010 [Propionispora sp. 2/2-37]
MNKRTWLHLAMIVCVAGILMFSYLGTQPLLDPDEPVYAETAKEMFTFHDIISPRIYGEFWYDKPPMYYWLVAGAFKIFGVGEFAARFPSALFAVGGAIAVYLAGRRMFSERGGLLSALVLATSLEYFYLGNAAVTDMTLTFFLTTALLSFFHRNYYAFYVFAALSVVTKGPVGLFFCGVIVGIYLLITSNWMTLKNMKLVRGTVLFSVIALPWYLAMYWQHGMAFIDTFLGFHNVTRFLQPEHVSGKIWYFYIPVLLIGFFPWTAFLAQAFTEGVKEKGEKRNACIFLALWASAVFLFFSLSQTKLISYILPMFPPLALLVGYYLDKVWEQKRYGALKGTAILFGAAVAILAAALFYGGTAVTARLIAPVKMITGVLFLMAVIVFFYSWRRNFRAVVTAYTIGMLAFTTVFMTQALPVVAPAVSMKKFVGVFKQYYNGQGTVYVAKFYRPGFMFYSGVPSIEFDSGDVKSIVDKNETAYVIMKKAHFEKIPQEIKDKVQIKALQEDRILFIHTAD